MMSILRLGAADVQDISQRLIRVLGGQREETGIGNEPVIIVAILTTEKRFIG